MDTDVYCKSQQCKSVHDITLIPALRHLETASGTAARGGSIIDINPTKRKLSVGKFGSSELNLKSERSDVNGLILLFIVPLNNAFFFFLSSNF